MKGYLMRFFIGLSIFGIFTIALIPISSQQEGCNSEDYATLASELEELVGAISTSDSPDFVLSEIQRNIDAFIDDCDSREIAVSIVEGELPPPIVFDSSTAGLQAVIGPVDLPTGLYRVTATTAGYMIGDIEAISGECDAGFMGLYNITQGQATDGAETILKSDDCNGLISISNTQGAWTLEFQQLDPELTQELQTIYSSEDESLQAVIGPIVIPSGTYRVTATTTGFIIADIEELSGNCDTGFLGLFNLFAGDANDGAETLVTSSNCVGLITVGNTQEPWTIEFEKLN
jgi:hypothetical protein